MKIFHFIQVVSVPCCCLLGFIDNFIEAATDKIIHLSYFFIAPGLTISNCSCGPLYPFFFFPCSIQTFSQYLQSLYTFLSLSAHSSWGWCLYPFPCLVTISVTIFFSLFCSFVCPAFLRLDYPPSSLLTFSFQQVWNVTELSH